jgi:hypothetical protein
MGKVRCTIPAKIADGMTHGVSRTGPRAELVTAR